MAKLDAIGGCLCGAVRYEARGRPLNAGYCCCSDCRRVSGSGFVGFMGYLSTAIRFSGATREFACKSLRGEAVRNSCVLCASLVFGGRRGLDAQHTIYAGSLDDPSVFIPQIAIFTRDRPAWVLLPPGLQLFETMPG